MKPASLFLVSLVVLAVSCAGPQRIPSNNWSEVAEKTLEATVLIESQFEYKSPETGKVLKYKAVGTGSVLSSDGWILSNAHVVSDNDGYTLANLITIRFKDGRVFMADKVFSFPKNDLALMKINASNLDFLKIRAGRVTVGEEVLAVGHPIPYTWAIKEGIVVSDKFDPYGGKDVDEAWDIEHIVTSATIHSGFSGGPVVDRNGFIIGTDQAIYPKKFIFALVISTNTMLYVLDTVSGIMGKKIYSLSK